MSAKKGGTLILGAGGMLGRALAREFPGARRLTRAELDITDSLSVERAIGSGVALVVNAAAFTGVDRAESDPCHWAVNSEAVGRLAELCLVRGARLVHVSTDYVFDGQGTRPYREDDPVSPVNAYGQGKLAGERRALEVCGTGGIGGTGDRGDQVLIVRTSWLFGAGGPNFIESILRQAEAGKTVLEVVADQRGRPTYAVDLGHAIRTLAETHASGIVHFANGGEAAWYDVAVEALRAAGFSGVRVSPCTTAAFPRPARRPLYSVLDTKRYEHLTGETPRPWRRAVGDYVSTRAAALALSVPQAPLPESA